jgi:hypothetical protein
MKAIRGAIMKMLGAMAAWRPGFVQAWIKTGYTKLCTACCFIWV